MFVELLRTVLGRLVIVFVDRNVGILFFVRVRCGPGDNGHREEREPSGDKCEEVLEEPRDRLDGVDAIAGCVVGIVAVGADSLIVHQADSPKDAILNQRVHDGAVDLPEELSGVLSALREQNEAVVVEQVAVELIRCAGLPALPAARALEIDKFSKSRRRDKKTNETHS